MGLEDMANAAKDMLGSEAVEGMSDNVLDAAGDAANNLTGDKFEAQIDQAQDAADSAIGNE